MNRKTIIAIFTLVACVTSTLGIVAQQLIVPPGNPHYRPKAVPKKVCPGGWTGVVTYTKTLNDSLESDEAGIRKEKDRIKHRTSRVYKYTGRAIVDAKDARNTIVKTSLALTDNDLNWSENRVWESCGNRGDTSRWQIVEGNDDRVTQGTATGPASSFHLNVNESDGTYSFSIGFSEFQGQKAREQHVKRSGFCQPRNNQPSDSSTNESTRIDRDSVSVDDGKVDPEDPNVLSGSRTWGYDGTGEVKGFVYRVSWHFTRCPQELLITELILEEADFPNYDSWREIDDLRGTIDGNRVRIRAKILNLSAEQRFATVKLSETYKNDQFRSHLPDQPLPESDTTVRLDGGEEREIEYMWNTEGEAWFNTGQAHLIHRIKAELSEGPKKWDQETKPLNISPKPLVLVHGLWSNANAWIPLYQNILNEEHSYRWKAYAVGEKPEHGRMNTGGSFLSSDKTNSIYENADELEKYIRYAQETSNAWHVDIVAHSLGGLISRLYIHRQMPLMPNSRPQVKNLVMLGTPNAGSPCADVIDMKFSAYGERVQAVKDLKPENVAIFNQHVNNRKGVKFSALAGQSIPVMCKNAEWNDGVVSVSSAIFGVTDHAFTNDIHTDLTNGKNYSRFVRPHVVTGPDGKYPLEVRSDVHPIDSFENIDWSFNSPSPVESIFARSTDAESGEYRDARHYGARSRADDATRAPGFATELAIAPGKTVDIDLPVAAGPNLGITLLADPDVSAALIDPSGKTRAVSTARSTLARHFFRSLFIGKPVEEAKWKIRIENKSTVERVVMMTSWQTSSTVSRPQAAASVKR